MLMVLVLVWLQPYKGNKFMRFLGEFFIGPLRPEGTWQVLKSPDSRFVRKYGALFEDHRGPPMVLRGATYATDPVTGWVNRGKLESHLGRPLISFRYPSPTPRPYRPVPPQALVYGNGTVSCLLGGLFLSCTRRRVEMQISQNVEMAAVSHCHIKTVCLKSTVLTQV